MRLTRQLRVESIDEETEVSLLPAEPEDMWHAHNLISPKDIVKARTSRKLTTKTATGSVESEKVAIDLRICVTSTLFDPAASSLRVTGQVVEENKYVAIGQHHTLELELNHRFSIIKPKGWDSVALDTLKEAINEDKSDALVAVVMQPGMANICLITDYQTILKQRVDGSVSSKRAEAKEKASGYTGFYDKVLSTLLRTVDLTIPRPLLLASPGFCAQDFREYIKTEGQRTSDKMLMRIAREAVVVHSATGHVYALNQVLKSSEVQATVKGAKFSKETTLMDQFFERMRKDDGRAWYGPKPVEKAVKEGAVGRGGGVLLINNSFFRSMDIATRKRFVGLVDRVKADGGEARVLSSDHESGQRLDSLGGIAAVLTYPIYDLDESDDEGEGGEGATGEGEEMII
ncbi:eRF1 domain 1 domain containing protein [Naviculisporaceae sp. PSN 640]